MWIVCFLIAIGFLLLAITAAIIIGNKPKMKSNRVITPFNTLFAGLFITTLVLMSPVYYSICPQSQFQLFKTIFFTIQGTFQVFTIDADATMIIEGITVESIGRLAPYYSSAISILFVVAPIFTFGFLLSFFKNITAYMLLFFKRGREIYVFSELNEKSLSLAEDIIENREGKKNDECSKAIIVFTDVFENNEERSYELIGRAKELGGICFKNDILAVKLTKRIYIKKKKLHLFVIGSDESENINQGLKLIQMYEHKTNSNIKETYLYVLSTRIESELLLSYNADPKSQMKVRRVNEVQSLINQVLYECGNELFKSALPIENGEKKIRAVIVGLGNHGTEMLKALAWYCQMDGYHIEIDAFEKDALAKERLMALCPELLSDDYNGVSKPGEAEYTIRIHSGIDVNTKEFVDCISDMKDVTYAFVCLGSDEDNVKTAVNLRMLFERGGIKPMIQAVVYNSDEKKALSGITNYHGQEYNIDFIGDLKSSYSENVIINSELVEYALERHKKWGTEEEFWQYEYNYRSSIASAIHLKARIDCGINGADKSEEQLTDDERKCIEALEHRRWNAYMRAEGYIYSGSPDKSSRNDLAKMHHDLVDFSLLSDEEREKDSKVGTI